MGKGKVETAFINDGVSLKNYFKDIGKIDLVDSKEQIELVKKAQKGDRIAMDKLIECNLRFVLTIAKEYVNRGLDIEDLISEGNIGLIKAVEKFDPSRGVVFISFAVWWVRQSIMQAICENGNVVRIPVNKINDLNKIGKAKEKLEKDLGREPSLLEISDETELSIDEIRVVSGSSTHEVSLDAKLDDNSEGTIYDVTPGTSYDEFEDELNYRALKREIEQALENLTDRESEIIKMYWGICGSPKMNLKEIGESMKLTNERVRQLKEVALKKLRVFDRSSKLKEFLNGKI
jgi:RNA polymerase primary sigma factor